LVGAIGVAAQDRRPILNDAKSPQWLQINDRFCFRC